MRYLLLILFVSISFSVFSQSEFSVFFYSGNVKFKKARTEYWNEIDQLNLKIDVTDSIYIKQGSQLFLISKSGKQILLHKEGKYYLENLIKSIPDNEQENIIAAYAEFIWEEFNNKHQDIEKYADKHMREKGGVSRAVNLPEIFMPVYGTYIISDKILFSWKNEGNVFYNLSFWDDDVNGKKLFELLLKDTLIKISTISHWIPKNKTLYWSLSLIDKRPANFIPIKILGKKEKREISSKISEIEKIIENVRPEFIWLIKASFYEQNNLLNQANNSYLNALDLSNNDQNILEYYNLFLARTQQLNK